MSQITSVVRGRMLFDKGKAAMRSRLWRDSVTLFGAQGFVKLCALVGSVAAVRALGPAEMGLLGRVTVAAGVLGLACGLGTDFSGPILIKESDEKHRNVAAERFLALRTVLLCVAAALLFGFAVGREWHAQRGVSGYFCVVAALASGLLITNGLNPIYVLQGYDAVRALARPQVITAVLTALGNLWVATFFPYGSGYLAVQSLAAFVLAWLALRPLQLAPWGNKDSWTKPALANSWKENRRVGSLTAWIGSIAIYVYGQGDALAVSLLSDTSELGDFMGALSIVAATNALIGIIPSIIYSRQLAWMKEGGRDLFRKQQSKLLILLLPFAAALAAISIGCSGLIAQLILGQRFHGSPAIFSTLLAISLLNLPYAAMASAFMAVGRSRDTMWLSLAIATISLPVYGWSAAHFGGLGAARVKCGLLILMTATAYVLHNRVILRADKAPAK